MTTRRPVWLTDEQWEQVRSALLSAADCKHERHGAPFLLTLRMAVDDLEPWLTVDDEGRVWRVWEIPDDDRYKYEYGGYDGELDREIDVPLYRLMSVDEAGESDQ